MRRALALLTIVGMLAHAYAVVRHNGSALAMSFVPGHAQSVSPETARELAALGLDIADICLTAHQGDNDGQQKQGVTWCPTCLGLSAAATLPAADPFVLAPPAPSSSIIARPVDERSERLARIRPSCRGPPTLA